MITSLSFKSLLAPSLGLIPHRWLSYDVGSMALDVVHLTSRSVIRVSGPQNSAISFLQGMVTNDMRPLESFSEDQRAIYAALLSPKGKVLYDLIFIREKNREDGGASLLMDVDARGIEGAMGLLNKYKMRRPVLIDDLSSSHQVFAAYPMADPSPSPSPSPSSTTPSPLLDSERIQRGWKEDPRLSALGLRGIFQTSLLPTCLDDKMKVTTDEGPFQRLRYLNGVAEGGLEMTEGSAVPLEYSLDSLNGVSYTKGCYVGQERISYTHYRGVIRKRCIPFRIDLASDSSALSHLQDQIVGCEVHLKRQGQENKGEGVGSVKAYSQGIGLAMVKMNALAAAEGLTIEPAGLKCIPLQPIWWKEEWKAVS